jgi:hypothetical protein
VPPNISGNTLLKEKSIEDGLMFIRRLRIDNRQ